MISAERRTKEICSFGLFPCLLNAETDGLFFRLCDRPPGDIWLQTTLLFVNILLQLLKCYPQLMLFLRSPAIPSLFCGVRFPCLISLKYSLQLTFFYQFLCSFKYLLSLGGSPSYVIRRGSSLEGHACNVILPNDNSSIWMSHKHFTLNMTNSKTIIFHSQFSPLLTSDQAHLRGISLSLFFFFWSITELYACIFKVYLVYLLNYKFCGEERSPPSSFSYPQHLAMS